MRMLPRMEPESLISAKRAAELLCCSKSQIKKLINQREIPAIRIGKKLIRIRARDFLDWIERNSISV